jgi:hypothetical protein
MFSEVQFVHRVDLDGRIDSVCTECFATVATAWDEREISSRELVHVCDPMKLYRIRQGLSASSPC